MSFTEWETEFSKPSHKIYRRVYIKRRAIGGAYDADWLEIDNERIKSHGQITNRYEYSKNIFIKTEPVTLKFNNMDGYFNDVDCSSSVFYGYSSRYKTMIKVEAGYYNDDNEEIGEPIIFVGIILSDIKTTRTLVSIKANPLIDVFKSFPVKDVPALYNGSVHVTITSAGFIRQLQENTTDGAGNDIFGQYFSEGAWNYDATPDIGLKHNDYTYLGIPTEANYGNFVFDFINDLTQIEDYVFYQSRLGDVVFARRNKLGNFHTCETAASAPDKLFMHTKFDDTAASEVGPDWVWVGDGTAATASYIAVKHGNGAEYTSTNDSWVEASVSTLYADGAFDPDKFTVEFWIQTKNNLATAGVIWPMFSYEDTADNYNHIKLWVNNTDGSNIIQLDKFGHMNTLGGCDYVGPTWTAGQNIFLAFVHDKDGIEGGTDRYRIYYALSDGAVTMAANAVSYRCPILPTSAAKFVLLGENVHGPTYRNSAAIDNIKVYNFAKTDFTDRDDEDGYMQPKLFNLVGMKDDQGNKTNLMANISAALNTDKIKNWIQIKYLTDDTTTSIAEQKESWTVGDSSSSDIYGANKLELINYYFDQSLAAERAEMLFNGFKDPKTDIDVQSLFTPFLNPQDHVMFTYQSPGYENSSFGGSFLFDGVDDVFEITATSFNFISEDFSICFNINPASTSYSMFISKDSLAQAGFQSELFPTGAAIDFVTSQNGAYQVTYSKDVLSAGAWQHIMIIREGETVTIYKNNEDVTHDHGTHIDPDAVTSGAGLYFGSYNGGANFYTGGLCDVRIFNKALSVSERFQVYKNIDNLGNLTSDGWYKCDESSGSTAADSSPNSIDATLANIDPGTFFSSDVPDTPSLVGYGKAFNYNGKEFEIAKISHDLNKFPPKSKITLREI